jgi:hypothetical protein
MAVYQINYDLRKQRNYESLYERLKSYPTRCRPLESCWLISTRQSASQIRDYLTEVMDKDDRLLVTRLSGEAAWTKNLGTEASRLVKAMLEKKAA